MASLIYHFLEDIIFKICDWMKKFCGILCCSSVYVIMRFIIMEKGQSHFDVRVIPLSCMVISLRSAYDHDIYHPPFSLFSFLLPPPPPPSLSPFHFSFLLPFHLFFLRLKSGTVNPVPTVAALTGLIVPRKKNAYLKYFTSSQFKNVRQKDLSRTTLIIILFNLITLWKGTWYLCISFV